jgi:dehydrogenase/reductase SDR family member 12
MTPAARIADAALEITIAASFSSAGLAVRSRLLPEFTADDRPSFASRVAIVTGATSGLGLATATELARRRGTVHLLARDRGRAARAQRQIIAETGNASVSYGIADLAERASLREFADGFATEYTRLDVLVHNAGAMFPSYQVNDAGIELTFAGQVLGQFALTSMLLPQLLAAAPARVIAVSSGGMYGQPLARSVAPMAAASYRGVTAYARAKRAQVALSAEWARRFPASDIAFHAMHPGWADTPGVAASLPAFRRLLGPVLRTPAEGADTTVWLATASPELLGSGRFWHDRRPRRVDLVRKPPAQPQAALSAALWDRLDVMTHSPAG